MRGIIKQSVATESIHAGGQGGATLEERVQCAAVTVTVATVAKAGCAHSGASFGLCSVVYRGFPGLGRNRKQGRIVVAGRAMAHGVVETGRSTVDRHRCCQPLVINVAAGADRGVQGIGVGMNTPGCGTD